MTKQTMLIGGGIASGLVILILVILLMGTSKQQQATPTKLPRIDQAKVMKRIDHEIFGANADLKYVENHEIFNENTYVDGQKIGDNTITGAVFDSIGLSGHNIMSFNFFKEHQINNVTTKWDKDGNTFVAKGNFVAKETGKKYPFAFKLNDNYMILQEWFGANIRI
ncbi:hypothetical protein [Leuconostoc citreum]|uniref:hypothetical protein n=1 Tax=Leuconostoc citreum TaxID=33964 RepID=UPI0032DF5122